MKRVSEPKQLRRVFTALYVKEGDGIYSVCPPCASRTNLVRGTLLNAREVLEIRAAVDCVSSGVGFDFGRTKTEGKEP
jgi:hypothetical protein